MRAMNKLNRFSSIFLYLSALAGILWMGSYLSRLFLTFQLFEEDGITFKTYITEENLEGILITLNAVITSTFVLYIIFILSFLIFLLTTKIKLKEEGWLFIVTIIIFITLPFEVYLMTFDYKIIRLIINGNFDLQIVADIFIKRSTVLSSFPLVELFSYFSIIYFCIFQPLKRKTASL
jgi:hypothetical protein